METAVNVCISQHNWLQLKGFHIIIIGKTSVSESGVSIGDSLQEVPSTEYLVDEVGLNNANEVSALNNEANGKMETTELNEVGMTDLNEVYEKTDLSEKVDETPENVADSETTLTGMY